MKTTLQVESAYHVSTIAVSECTVAPAAITNPGRGDYSWPPDDCTRNRRNGHKGNNKRHHTKHTPEFASDGPHRHLRTLKMYLDAEMVQANGWNPVARWTLLNDHEQVVYDTYIYHRGVKIEKTLPWLTGIQWKHLKPSNGAMEFETAKHNLLALIKDCILVMHSGENEAKALKLACNPRNVREVQRLLEVRGIRDTQKFSEYMSLYPHCNAGPSLKNLVRDYFEEDIQSGAHCCRVDATYTRRLYKESESAMDEEQGVLDTTEGNHDSGNEA